jgi:hypothetical protein
MTRAWEARVGQNVILIIHYRCKMQVFVGINTPTTTLCSSMARRS